MSTERTEPRVGDEVLIRATIRRWEPTSEYGLLVEMHSETGHYTAWLRPEFIAEVIVPDLPGEPADGTWLAGTEPGGVNTRVFVRDDTNGHNDPDRRYDRRWWDVAAEEWVDWPTAVRRGADPARPLGAPR